MTCNHTTRAVGDVFTYTFPQDMERNDSIGPRRIHYRVVAHKQVVGIDKPTEASWAEVIMPEVIEEQSSDGHWHLVE